MVLELFTIIIVEMAMQTYTDDKNIEFNTHAHAYAHTHWEIWIRSVNYAGVNILGVILYYSIAMILPLGQTGHSLQGISLYYALHCMWLYNYFNLFYNYLNLYKAEPWFPFLISWFLS